MKKLGKKAFLVLFIFYLITLNVWPLVPINRIGKLMYASIAVTKD